MFALLHGYLPTANAQLRCIELFKKDRSDFNAVSALIQKVPTDKAVIFPLFREQSIHSLLDWIINQQTAQYLGLFQIEAQDLRAKIFIEYADTFANFLRVNQFQVNEIKDHFSKKLKVEELIGENPNFEDLKYEIIGILTRTNALLAEMLASAHFTTIVSAEKTMKDVLQETHPHVLKQLESEFGEADFSNFLTKKIDVISEQDGQIYWVEVKYLGRNKIYGSISGHDVIKKMKEIKRAAGLVNPNIKVVVAIVGTGILSKEVRKEYAAIGVEILELTPQLQNQGLRQLALKQHNPL